MTARIIIAAVLAVIAGGIFHAQELTEKNYDSIREQILPSTEEEEWRKIDWHPTYWDGVTAAQKADKPVMLFAMNGHPFGCT